MTDQTLTERRPTWMPVLFVWALAFAGGIVVSRNTLPGTLAVMLALLVSFFIAMLAPLAYRLGKGTFDPLEISVVFVFLYAAYTILPIFSLMMEKRLGFDEQVYLKAFSLSLSGLLAFWLGYHIVSGNRQALALGRYLPRHLDMNKAELGAAFLLSVGIASLAYVIVSLGGIGSLQRLQYTERHMLTMSVGTIPLFAGVHFVNIGLLIYFHVAYSGRRLRAWLVFFSVLALYSFVLFRLGRRLPFWTGFLPLIVYYHYRIRRIPVRQGVLLIMALGFVLAVWGRTRNIPAGIPVITFVRANISSAWFDPGQNEFRYPAIVALTVVDAIPARFAHTFGRTYLEAFLVQIPRAIFPDRPLPLNVWFSKTFFPRLYARGAGYAFSMIAEAYMNFSYFGPVFVLFIVGVICRFISSLRRHVDSIGVTLCYCSICPWLMVAMRSEFASLLKGYFVLTLAPLLVLLYFSAKHEQKPRGSVASDRRVVEAD